MNGATRANKNKKELDIQEHINNRLEEFEKKKLAREDKAVRRFMAYSAAGSYRARSPYV